MVTCGVQSPPGSASRPANTDAASQRWRWSASRARRARAAANAASTSTVRTPTAAAPGRVNPAQSTSTVSVNVDVANVNATCAANRHGEVGVAGDRDTAGRFQVDQQLAALALTDPDDGAEHRSPADPGRARRHSGRPAPPPVHGRPTPHRRQPRGGPQHLHPVDAQLHRADLDVAHPSHPAQPGQHLPHRPDPRRCRPSTHRDTQPPLTLRPWPGPVAGTAASQAAAAHRRRPAGQPGGQHSPDRHRFHQVAAAPAGARRRFGVDAGGDGGAPGVLVVGVAGPGGAGIAGGSTGTGGMVVVGVVVAGSVAATGSPPLTAPALVGWGRATRRHRPRTAGSPGNDHRAGPRWRPSPGSCSPAPPTGTGVDPTARPGDAARSSNSSRLAAPSAPPHRRLHPLPGGVAVGLDPPRDAAGDTAAGRPASVAADATAVGTASTPATTNADSRPTPTASPTGTRGARRAGAPRRPRPTLIVTSHTIAHTSSAHATHTTTATAFTTVASGIPVRVNASPTCASDGSPVGNGQPPTATSTTGTPPTTSPTAPGCAQRRRRPASTTSSRCRPPALAPCPAADQPRRDTQPGPVRGVGPVIVAIRASTASTTGQHRGDRGVPPPWRSVTQPSAANDATISHEPAPNGDRSGEPPPPERTPP